MGSAHDLYMTGQRHRAYRFFRGKTGFVGEDAKTALILARAETDAADADYEFEWSPDPEPDLSWLGPGEKVNEVLVCTMVGPGGDYVESLMGITDPSSEYRRIVEAELALAFYCTKRGEGDAQDDAAQEDE